MNNDINNIGKVVPLPTAPVSKKQQNNQANPLTRLQDLSQVRQKDQKEAVNRQDNLEKGNVLEADFGQLKQAVKDVNAVFQETQRNLQFQIDEDTQEMVVKIVDKESGEVIRQIPSEEMLALTKRMQELDAAGQHGLVLRDKA
ncbi:flagellar protein FlaG [methane-oxidizing endosymbiont of Gigantopelta aegis]|uniref:flagellar protein FlaG n=1 Tax=methane-oxidizing endosymbiont of Gigantopelta aegis TaxID=2794938 RepID=UPI0018DDDF35|nr:flagellar protein FlaG [methane-oxidizing endosymbiont of Gigantopelta aegis]